MNIYSFDQTQMLLFFAALVRVSCMLMILPIFGHNAIPNIAKVLFSFALTLVLFPMAQPFGSVSPTTVASSMGVLMLVLREAMVGLIVGFVIRTLFDAATFACSFMAMQMGFTMAAQYDPQAETSTPVVAQFVMILATLLMLVTDTHHMIIKGLAETFQIIPIGTGTASKALVGYIFDSASHVFVIGIKISAPMALVIFLINLAFGIVAKAVPQINILVVSLSVNMIAGFLVLLLTLPSFSMGMNEVFAQMITRMLEVTRYLHG